MFQKKLGENRNPKPEDILKIAEYKHLTMEQAEFLILQMERLAEVTLRSLLNK